MDLSRLKSSPDRYSADSSDNSPVNLEDIKSEDEEMEISSAVSSVPLNLSCESGSFEDEDLEDEDIPQDLSLRKSERSDFSDYNGYGGLLMCAAPIRKDIDNDRTKSKRSGGDAVTYKRVRLEETVNHIRKCSSENVRIKPDDEHLRRVLSCSDAKRKNGRKNYYVVDKIDSDESIHKDELDNIQSIRRNYDQEGEWTPEKIFVIPEEKSEEDNGKSDNKYSFPLNPLQMPYLLNGAPLGGIESERELLLQRLMQLSSMQLLGVSIPPEYQALMRQLRSPASAFLSWPHAYASYYTQLMQGLQNQELLRQHYQQQQQQQNGTASSSPERDLPSPNSAAAALHQEEASLNSRKRAPRALTGKHVRHGTGASPSTLFTLRKKIEQRQRIKEVLGDVPPSRNRRK